MSDFLLNPNVDPNKPQGLPPISRLSPDNQVKLEESWPTTKVAKSRWYKMTLPGASMYRPDGKRMVFHNQFYETFIQEDIDYLDKEIRGGAIKDLVHATEEEIQTQNMRRDPRGTVRAELEQETTSRLTAELQAKFASALVAAGVDVSMQKQLLNSVQHDMARSGPTDESKLAGVENDLAKRLREELDKGLGPREDSGGAKVLEVREPYRLSGIQHSGDVADNSAGNGQVAKQSVTLSNGKK